MRRMLPVYLKILICHVHIVLEDKGDGQQEQRMLNSIIGIRAVTTYLISVRVYISTRSSAHNDMEEGRNYHSIQLIQK